MGNAAIDFLTGQAVEQRNGIVTIGSVQLIGGPGCCLVAFSVHTFQNDGCHSCTSTLQNKGTNMSDPWHSCTSTLQTKGTNMGLSQWMQLDFSPVEGEDAAAKLTIPQ